MDPVVPQEQAVVETPAEPEYSYAEIHDNTPKEIVETPAATPEEKPAEVTPEPEAPKVEEPAIDVEKLAEEAARKVLEEQEARARAEAEANKPQEDEYTKFEREMWEKEKRQPTYKEALEFVSEQAEKRLELKQQEKIRLAEEEKARTQQQYEEETKRLNSVVDDELEDLYRANKLTRIKDPNNPNDQGVLERKALFATWQQVNEERAKTNQPQIYSATRIAEFYWKKPSNQPANVNAPVMGNNGASIPMGAEPEYSYSDLKKPWSFFKR